MKKIIGIIGILIIGIGLTFADTSSLEDAIKKTTNTLDVKLDSNLSSETGGSGIKSLLSYAGIKIIIPIGIMLGILIAIIGFYNIMFTKDAESKTKGKNFLLYGTIGVLLAVSGGIMGEKLVGETGTAGIMKQLGNVVGINTAVALYEQLIYPFIKVAMYLIVGILFIILVIHFFKFIWSPSEEIKAQSQRIIVWNIVGILVILSAKRIVEAAYGTKNTIIEPGVWGISGKTQLTDIGEGVLTQSNLIFLYNILNWFMGLIAFIILIIIIYQTFLLLTKPEDQEMMKNIKRSILYIFIGIVMIGAAYLLTNFVIVQAV